MPDGLDGRNDESADDDAGNGREDLLHASMTTRAPRILRGAGRAPPRRTSAAQLIVPQRSVQIAKTAPAPWRLANSVCPSGLKQAPAHSLPVWPGYSFRAN